MVFSIVFTRSEMWYGLTAAAGTALYALLLPSANVHTIMIALGFCFISAVCAASMSTSQFQSADIQRGVALFVVFAVSQVCFQRALQGVAAVVELNNKAATGLHSLYNVKS